MRWFVVLSLCLQLSWFGSGQNFAQTLQAASFPFSDRFEGAELDANWSSTTTGSGVVELSSTYPYSGSQSLFLGTKLDQVATAETVLSIDLAGQTNAFLSFWLRRSGNNGVANIAISDNNGANWSQVRELINRSSNFGREVVDLGAAAEAAGLNLNANFQIRFAFSTNFGDKTNAGIILDELQITERAALASGFPLASTGFEATELPFGFFATMTGSGVVEANDTYPRSGSQSLFIGTKADSEASADAILLLDLRGQSEVFLSFWLRRSGNNGVADVSISDDEGATWHQVRDLSSRSVNFGHELIDISGAAEANSLSLNGRFQVRIHFNTNFGTKTNAGIVLDDLQLSSRAAIQLPFPFSSESFEADGLPSGLFASLGGTGTVEVNDTYPRTGSQSLFIGTKANLESYADAIFPLDLRNQPSAYLELWLRRSGNNGVANVSISDDEGATWHQIRNLTDRGTTFSREVIDLVAEAEANSLSLNGRFQVRIHFNTNFGDKTNAGIVIDDLRFTIDNPTIERTYIPLVRFNQ